jgi:hypothetical protein
MEQGFEDHQIGTKFPLQDLCNGYGAGPVKKKILSAKNSSNYKEF